MRERLLGIGGWAIVYPSLALVAVRALHLESRSALIAALSLLPVLLLPAYAVAVAAVAARRRALAASSLVVVAAHLVWVAPVMWPVRSAVDPPAGATELRLFVANIRARNDDMTGVAAEIERAQADVVALVELTGSQLQALRDLGALDGYDHEATFPHGGTNGFGVWSSLPLHDVEVWDAGHHPQVRGALEVDGELVDLHVVHTYAPVAGNAGAWRADLSAIADEVDGDGAGHTIVAGDFNATHDHEGFREILGTGLRDAAVERGQGWAATWPRGMWFVPPLVRPDHVLVSPDVAVVGYHLDDGGGSDHRSMVVDLAVPT